LKIKRQSAADAIAASEADVRDLVRAGEARAVAVEPVVGHATPARGPARALEHGLT